VFVCLYGNYINPHFWTDLNQTLHTSPPWSGGSRRVCMDPQYFNFPTFSTYFVGSECRFVRVRWLPATEPPPPFCVISRVGVTSRTWRALCVMHRKRGGGNGMHVCGNGNLMGREGNEWWIALAIAVAFIQMITKNLSNFRPSSFRTLSRDNTFFRLLNLSRRYSEMFR